MLQRQEMASGEGRKTNSGLRVRMWIQARARETNRSPRTHHAEWTRSLRVRQTAHVAQVNMSILQSRCGRFQEVGERNTLCSYKASVPPLQFQACLDSIACAATVSRKLSAQVPFLLSPQLIVSLLEQVFEMLSFQPLAFSNSGAFAGAEEPGGSVLQCH